MDKSVWKTLGFDVVRAIVYGLIIIMMLIAATFLLGNQEQLQGKYLKAVACVLAAPVTDEGRSNEEVRRCFENEELEPPTFLGP